MTKQQLQFLKAISDKYDFDLYSLIESINNGVWCFYLQDHWDGSINKKHYLYINLKKLKYFKVRYTNPLTLKIFLPTKKDILEHIKK